MGIGKKIAIPTFATRVSPRFDYARSILVVSVDDEKPSVRQEITVPNWTPHVRINKLLDLDVDTVVCGGIDCWSVAKLQSAGVTVYGWVTGEVEDALTALFQGDLSPETAVQASGCQERERFSADDGEHSQLRFSH